MKKVGKIELMRFVFATCVIFFHLCGDLWNRKHIWFSIRSFDVSFFPHGNIGVEFFFLVSGFLMAKKIYKTLNRQGESKQYVGPETVSFIWSKLRSILPYSIPISIIMIGIQLIFRGFDIDYLIKKFPSFLFLQRTGIGDSAYIGVTWYISSLLLAMAILYPICKKYYYTFTALLAPLAALFLYGYLVQKTGSIADANSWLGFTYKCNFRAIAGVGLGTTCFEITRRLQDREFSEFASLGFSLLELLCYGVTFVYICTNISSKYSGQIALILFVAVTISFSQKTVFGNSKIFQNKFVYYLGKLSLPMYLSQDIFRKITPRLCEGMDKTYICVITYACIIVFSIVMMKCVGKITQFVQTRNKFCSVSVL